MKFWKRVRAMRELMVVDGGPEIELMPQGCLFSARKLCLCPNKSLRRSFSNYHKLPQAMLTLSVLKLDGSCFDVQVSKTATIAELKGAVENVFIDQLNNNKEINISWSHVWSHFCLCYKGKKLLNNKDHIRLFGIRDEDQLCFVQHLSINANGM